MFKRLAIATLLLTATCSGLSAAEKLNCVGFLFFFQCKAADEPPAPVLSNFCGKMRSRIEAFVFTREQVGALSRAQRQALASIKRDYEQECLGIKRNAK
jgi:hypothetical protein